MPARRAGRRGSVRIALGQPAKATDEIQVYNAGIAAPGQFTIQQHLNYIALGLKDPPFPGGLVSNHSLNGTPEFAYGVTDWWEVGLYLPFAVKIRNSCRMRSSCGPCLSRPMPTSATSSTASIWNSATRRRNSRRQRFTLEVRPIIGVRNADWEFIVNPIVDAGFGKLGELDFAPAARLARKLAPDTFLGLEYYSDFGEIGNFARLADQQHTLFLVTDFKLGVFDVDFGVGYGLTPSSDRWVVKTIIGYAFPVPGSNSSAGERSAAGPVNPMSHTSTRFLQP